MIELNQAIPAAERVITYFSPAKSPLYVVLLSAAVSAVMTCTDVEGVYWVSISSFLLITAGVAVFLAFRKTNDASAGGIDRQIGFAKATSISAALLTITFAAPLSQHHNMVFNILLCACAAQALVFMIPNVARPGRDGATVNIVQLTLITGCLLATSATSLSHYAARCRLGDIEQECYGESFLKYPSSDTYAAPPQTLEGLSEEKVELLREAKRLQGSVTRSIFRYYFTTEASLDRLVISPMDWNKYRDERSRFMIVGAVLLGMWSVCLVFWITFIPLHPVWGSLLRTLLGIMISIAIVWGVSVALDYFGYGEFRTFIQDLPPLVMPVVYVACGIGFATFIKTFNR